MNGTVAAPVEPPYDKFNLKQRPIPRNFQEEELATYAGPDGEAYRYVTEPTWEYVWLIRVVKRGDTCTLTVKQLTAEGFADDLGKVAQKVERRLPLATWTKIEQQVAASAFWTKPTWDKKQDDVKVLDGSYDWIEGYRNGKTHMVKRESVGALPEDKLLNELTTTLYMLKPPAVGVRASGNSHTKHSNGAR